MIAQNPASQPPLTQADIRSIFYGIMLAMLLSSLDQTIVATAMPTIGREFGDLDHLPWIVTAYLLASTAVTPLYGKFSDMHGRRVTLLIGITIFMVGSVACALAPSLLALIVARGIQGIGGGGLIAIAQTIVADMVTPRERGRYQVYFGAVFALSSLAGPLLGGVFAERLHWSMIFWINLPLGLLAFALTNSRLKRLPRHDRRHRLDIVGAVLMTSATVTLMLVLNWGGVRFPWLSPELLGFLALSVTLWACFAWRLGTAQEPLIPPAVLLDRVVGCAALASALGMGTFIALTIFVPIYFEAVRGFTAQQSGLALIPYMIGIVIGSTASGRAMATLRHYKRIPVCGLALAVLCVLTITLLLDRLPYAGLAVLLLLTSVGLGTLMPVATVATQNAVQPQHLGTATATMNFCRQLFGALTVALYGAIALGDRGSGHGITLEALTSGAVSSASFRIVFGAAVLGLAASLTFLVLMEERPLRDKRLTAPEIPAEPAL